MKTIDLKLLRTEKKMTQDDLANLLGYSTNGFISQIETGIKKLPHSLEVKLIELFGDISEYYKEVSDEPIEQNKPEMVVLPKSILDDISKLTETIYSQQRLIEKLINNDNRKD